MRNVQLRINSTSLKKAFSLFLEIASAPELKRSGMWLAENQKSCLAARKTMRRTGRISASDSTERSAFKALRPHRREILFHCSENKSHQTMSAQAGGTHVYTVIRVVVHILASV